VGPNIQPTVSFASASRQEPMQYWQQVVAIEIEDGGSGGVLLSVAV
jgi:hypothetical protein